MHGGIKMDSNQLLDALKAHTGAASDNALARKVLKVDPTAVRDMRERGLSDAKAVQIATLLHLNPGEVLAAVHAERAKDPEVRKAWERLVKTVRSAAAGLFVVLGIAAGTPEPARAAVETSPVIHYAKRRWRALWAVLRSPAACFAFTGHHPSRGGLPGILQEQIT